MPVKSALKQLSGIDRALATKNQLQDESDSQTSISVLWAFRLIKVAVFCSILLLLTLSSGVIQQSNGITYGEEVLDAAQSVPWVVVVESFGPEEESPSSFCSGTLVDRDIVLTAAHCIPTFGSFRIRYGISTFTESDNFYSVQGAWRHPRYSERRYGVNDVGLLKLESPIPGASFIPLAKRSDLLKLEKSSIFQILGWGVDQNNVDATYLRRAWVNNETDALRNKVGKFFNDDIWLAAGRYLKRERVYSGACSGDSGGPLLAQKGSKFVQVGVVSFGAKSCDVSMPTIFMKTSYYLKDFSRAISRLRSLDPTLDRTKPISLSLPSISGTPELGNRLTCVNGNWSANAENFEYIWFHKDGRRISSGPGLDVSKSLTGQEVTCKIFASSKAGTSEISAQVLVQKATPDALTPPTITGSARVGSTVTCNPGVWNKYTKSVEVSWFIGGSLGIVQSKGAQWVVPQDAAGRDVFCVVLGSGDGETQRYELNLTIPKKPSVSGSLKIVGMPTSGYAAGDGLTVNCSGAQAADGGEQSGTTWWIRDAATGTTPAQVHQGSVFPLPRGFFTQNKNRLLICQFWVSGPGGLTIVNDAVSIVEPRLPEAPSVTLEGFSDWGPNSSAWENLQITCKVTSYMGQSVAFSTTIEWVVYDLNAPYYPDASTPSVLIATGDNLILSRSILEQAVLKKLGCKAKITTLSGSSIGFSTGKYIDYSNIQVADTKAPTFSLVSVAPYNPPIRFSDPIVFEVDVADENSGVQASSISVRAVSADLKEITVSRIEAPYLLNGTSKAGRYELKFSFAPSNPVVLGNYRILISMSDMKSNSTGWQTLTTLEFLGVRKD
jgi:hypothetical protein